MNQYNYSIYLQLHFVNPTQFGSFKEHSDYFEYCVNKYNKVSQSAANPKEIKILEISEKYINICLYSNADLNKAPGRALNLLTRELLNTNNTGYDSYYSKHVYHKKLFLTSMYIPTEKNIMSDGEFVKALIDYLVKPRTEISEKEKTAMERIKIIAKESGLV